MFFVVNIYTRSVIRTHLSLDEAIALSHTCDGYDVFLHDGIWSSFYGA